MSETCSCEVKERLMQYIERNKLRITAIERDAGIREGSLRLSKRPSADFVRRVLITHPELSAEWLMRGTGNMFRSDGIQQVSVGRDNRGRIYNNRMMDNMSIDLMKKAIEDKDKIIAAQERTIQVLLGNLKP